MVSVLLTFQWSDTAAGPPWTRSDNPQSLRSPAGTEGGCRDGRRAASVRQSNFHHLLARSRIRRAGPIALHETKILGYEVPPNVQAELLGRSLPIQHRLDTTERAILALIGKPMPFSELVGLAQGLNLDREVVVTAISSLLRRGLVVL